MRPFLVLFLGLLSLVEGLGVVGGGLAAAGFTGFLGWAFQGVGPTPSAQATLDALPTERIESLTAIRIGSKAPKVALYCGAKVRPESYAPLAADIVKTLDSASTSEDDATGVLLLQSPFNM